MKKTTYHIIMSVILIASLSVSDASAETYTFPRNVTWKQLRTDHFTLVFAKHHRTIAQKVAGFAESVHDEMSEFFDYTGNPNTYVIITDHMDLFDQTNLLKIEDDDGDPIILSFGEPEDEGFLLHPQSQEWLFQQFLYQYASVIRHKMDRGMRFRMAQGVPDVGFSGWMDGGMAAYLNRKLQGERTRSSYFDMLMRAEMLDERLTTLDQKAAWGLRMWPENLGMFLYGYSFLYYLSEQYGEERLAQLNRRQSEMIPWPVFEGDAFEDVYGKSLNTLQEEWKTFLSEVYQAQIDEITSRQVTQSTPLSSSGHFTNSPVFSPDGHAVYYIEDAPHDNVAIVQLRLSDMTKVRLTEGHFSGDFSISHDEQDLYFSKTEIYKTFYEVSDLYRLDLTTRKVARLTKGERAFDPAIAPDGKTLVYVSIQAGNMLLMKMDLTSKEKTILLETSDNGRIRHPVFSSDSQKLAFQLRKPGEGWDIYLINSDGTGLIPVIVDPSTDMSPAWGKHDAYLFFSSDRTGVPNIFVYSLEEQMLYQVTNVLTGAFDPAVSPDGTQLVFERYSRDGKTIHLAELDSDEWKQIEYNVQQQFPNPYRTADPSSLSATNYNPIPVLLQPSFFPTFGEDEEGFQLGLNLEGEDYLEHHTYSSSVLYGVGSQRVAFDAEYLNKQFYPTVRVFGYDRAKGYSNLFQDNRGEDEDYWEREQGVGGDLRIPLYRTHGADLSLLTGYEYQQVKNLTDIDDLVPPWPDEGVLASASAGIVFESFNRTRYSISPEKGGLLLIKYRRYDELFDSDFNIDELVGEANLYLGIPFLRNHVLALRAAGGLSDGDTLTQGVFQLGGYLFNMPSEVWYGPQFFLRGYEENVFAGDRIALGTVEYRFPLWFPQRTLWDGRILVDSLAGTAFFETGDAWDNRDDEVDFKYSAGGELTVNLGLRYGKMPVSLGVGFAYGFDQDQGKSQVFFKLILAD